MSAHPQTLMLEPGATMPNSRLPVVIYRNALPSGDFAPLFEKHGWGGVWRNGVYDYDHYHSNAHEVLGIAEGRLRLRLGGDGGEDVEVEKGDVLILPAGTGHRRISTANGFEVVGAYPAGQERYDICRARDPANDLRISKVQLPQADPVGGSDGALLKLWR